MGLIGIQAKRKAMALADQLERDRYADSPRVTSGAGVLPSRLNSRPLQAKVRIAGMGAFLPPQRRTSADIDEATGRPPGTTERHTNVVERPLVTTETSSGMAVAAASRAIEASGLEASDIDLIISACAVPEQPIPAMAPLIQHGLGLSRSGIPAFDVNASCLSFVTAFDLAAQLIEARRNRNVLIVSSEIASRALPWDTSP